MRPPMSTRLLLDVVMIPLFLLLMADRYTGNAVHEWLGLVWLFLLFFHVRLNRGWYNMVFRGGFLLAYPAKALVNIAIIFFVAGVAASAIPLSKTLFMGGGGGLFARSVHIFFAHWCFLLAAVHLGLYWKRLLAPVRNLPFLQARRRYFRLFSRIAALLLAGYGAWAFQKRELFFPLTMSSSFSVWNVDDSPVLLFLDYIAIFHLWAWGTHTFSTFAARSGKGAVQNQARNCNDRIWKYSLPIVPCRHGEIRRHSAVPSFPSDNKGDQV